MRALIMVYMNRKITKTQFVNASEMADILSVTAECIRRWARRGLIPRLDLPSGRYAFDPGAVITHLQTQALRYYLLRSILLHL